MIVSQSILSKRKRITPKILFTSEEVESDEKDTDTLNSENGSESWDIVYSNDEKKNEDSNKDSKNDTSSDDIDDYIQAIEQYMDFDEQFNEINDEQIEYKIEYNSLKITDDLSQGTKKLKPKKNSNHISNEYGDINSRLLSQENEKGFFIKSPIPLNKEISQRKKDKLPSDEKKLHLVYTNPARFLLSKQKIKKLVNGALSQPKKLSRRNSVVVILKQDDEITSSNGFGRSNSVSSRNQSASASDSKKTFHSDKNQLKFNSDFESGNLYRVFSYPNPDSSNYVLLLRSDPGVFNTLWFYFSVSGSIQMDKEYTFHIINIVNRAKNWKEGQLPLVFAKEKPNSVPGENVSPPTLKNIDGWDRCASYCRYFKTNNSAMIDLAKKYLPVTKKQRNRTLKTLSFKIKFGDIPVKHPNKKHVYFFAMGLPFTYSDCLKHIKKLRRIVSVPRSPSRHGSNISFQAESLCKSIMQYDCPILTITNKHRNFPKKQNLKNLSEEELLRRRKKRGIIISCRVHPGESSSSHVCKSIIDFLLSPDSSIANELRDQFVFKIIPQLNPDGVISGNNRTAPTREDYEISDLGVNLNSVWNKVEEDKHPTLFKMKQMIRNFNAERQCILFLDIHGHYSNIGHFVFGYTNKENESNTDSYSYRFPRNLVQICNSKKNGKNIFEFDEDFIYNPDYYSSDGVAPVEILRSMDIPSSYTLETSMIGNNKYHYSWRDYELFGQCVAEAILDTFDNNKRLEEQYGDIF